MGLLDRAWRAGGDVGDEHIGKGRVRAFLDAVGRRRAGNFVALLGPAGDGDGRTVHVHLAITDLVEPSPSEHVVARLDAFGDAKLECGVVVFAAVHVPACVRFGRAAAFDGVDDHPPRARRGWGVRRQGDLAGAATVHGGANKGERLVDADGHDVVGALGVVGYSGLMLAGEVSAVGNERRVVEGGLVKGHRRLHDHVRGGSRE